VVVSRDEVSKGAQTRRAVLDAAIVRFGRDGYRAASVADIARDAGVGGTVAYAYFPGKEALFLAAADEDAAAVIDEGLAAAETAGEDQDWRRVLFFALVAGVDRHPLARRLLAGLEPGVTERVLELRALAELRATCVRRLQAEQLAGTARSDIDATAMGNGIVSILMALLMSVLQYGDAATAMFGDDVTAVLEAAIAPRRSAAPGR